MLDEKLKEIHSRIKRIIIIASTAIIIALCILLGLFLWRYYQAPETIEDLAYDAHKQNKQYEYLIYIEEETGYHPYLVLTRNYGKDNTVLLLRKYVLDERQPFNRGNGSLSYYGNSHIDEYLNTVYLKTLERETKNQIEITTVDITAKTAWGRGKNSTRPPVKEEILRKVFLLSDIEGGSGSKKKIREGEPLKYFTEGGGRITTHSNGSRSNWSFRTGAPSSPEFHQGVGFDTPSGLLNSLARNGVRPAFCLDRKVEIVESEDIVEGEIVYILKKAERE